MSNASKHKTDLSAEIAGTEDNRRRSYREAVITQGMIRALEGNELDAMFDKPTQVLVTNVSLHGVGFRTKEALDDTIFYSIEIGVGPLHLASRMRLVRVHPLPDGTFDIGAEFV